MSNMRRVGEGIGKTVREISHNSNRVTENFPALDRSVDSISVGESFKFDFRTQGENSVRLGLHFREFPVTCNINYPTTNVSCVANFTGPTDITTTGHFSGFASNHGGFAISSTGEIILPRTGCYDIYWESGAAGFLTGNSSQGVTVALTHNGITFTGGARGVTGYIALLGPAIYTYRAPSPLYALLGAKKGDTFGASMGIIDLSQGEPWFGLVLGGSFSGGATVTINLVSDVDDV